MLCLEIGQRVSPPKVLDGADEAPSSLARFHLQRLGRGLRRHFWKSGSAGVHSLPTAVPEVQQPVAPVGAEVSEVPEEAVGELLVPERARPPGLGQHGVVGPVVAHPLLRPKRPLAAGGGGVSPAALLPAAVLPSEVGQLQEDGA